MARGRHRLGGPGLARRAGADSTPGHTPKHRRRGTDRVGAEAVASFAAAITVAVIAVSGWYAASGASAVVQMLAR